MSHLAGGRGTLLVSISCMAQDGLLAKNNPVPVTTARAEEPHPGEPSWRSQPGGAAPVSVAAGSSQGPASRGSSTLLLTSCGVLRSSEITVVCLGPAWLPGADRSPS